MWTTFPKNSANDEQNSNLVKRLNTRSQANNLRQSQPPNPATKISEQNNP